MVFDQYRIGAILKQFAEGKRGIGSDIAFEFRSVAHVAVVLLLEFGVAQQVFDFFVDRCEGAEEVDFICQIQKVEVEFKSLCGLLFRESDGPGVNPLCEQSECTDTVFLHVDL